MRRIIIVSVSLFILFLACDNYDWRPIQPEEYESDNLAGKDFNHTDWEGLDVSGKNFRGANLKGSNLRDANFSQCDLREADLRDASLADTNFSGADLRGAKLEGAWLWRTDFTNARLDEKWARLAYLIKTGNGQGQNFSGYDLSNIIFDDHHNLEEADLSGVTLERTSLRICNLRRANLSNANLSRANLYRCHLGRANLVNANLQGSHLDMVNLSKADLTGANLQGADLTAADLSGAKITEEQLKTVSRLDCTIMPDGTYKVYDQERCQYLTPVK